MRKYSNQNALCYALGLLVLAFMGQVTSVQAYAQAQSCPDEISAQDKAVHYSLYYEEYKNGNYESALPELQWIIKCAPNYPEQTNDDRNFERLVKTYEGLAKDAPDEATAKAYLDSALTVFDTAVPVLTEVGAKVDELSWLINKGRFIQTHAQHLSDYMGQVPEIYLQAYQLAPEKVDAYYVKIIIDNYVRQGEKQQALDLMEEAEQQFGDNEDMVGFISQLRNNLFKTPEERMGFLEDQFEKDPENIEVAAELFDIYMDLGYRAEAADLGQKLVELQPSARTYQLLARMHLDDGEAEKALGLYEKALELPDAQDQARDIYYNMGTAQQQLGSLSKARAFYRKAIEADASFGKAYMAIGDLYVMAVSNCSSAKFEREDRAVYWLVVQYYEKAKSVDPSVASAANQKIGTYRKYYPTAEDLFFKGWKAGQSYKVDYGCYAWINETTAVRTP